MEIFPGWEDSDVIAAQNQESSGTPLNSSAFQGHVDPSIENGRGVSDPEHSGACRPDLSE
jgi:hypothetical protein